MNLPQLPEQRVRLDPRRGNRGTTERDSAGARRHIYLPAVQKLLNEWALLPLRVRGMERVKLHADLTILAKLSCALARAQAVPLAA